MFSPAQWGEYVLVLSTLSFAVMLLFSWQLACIWRFYLQAKQQAAEKELWSRLHKAWGIASIVLVCFALVFVCFFERYWGLIFSGVLSIIIAQWVGMRLIVLQLQSQQKKWALLSAFNALGSFAIAIILTVIFQWPPYSIFIASALIQAVIVAYLLVNKPVVYHFQSISSQYLWGTLLRYGILNVSIELVLTTLTLADRFIIVSYGDNAMLGMYGQCFSIAQFSIAGLSALFLARFNPTMNAALSRDVKHFRRLLPSITVKYCLLLLPIVVWISLYASVWSSFLLDEAYRQAVVIVFPVSLAYFLYGLTLLSENEALFQGNYQRILIIYGVALIISVVATLFGVIFWAYRGAAWATLVAYAFIFLWFNPFKYLSKSQLKRICTVLIFLGIQSLIHYWFNFQSVFFQTVEFIAFLSIYFYFFILFRPLQK